MPRRPILPWEGSETCPEPELLRFGSFLDGGPEECPGSTLRSFSQPEAFLPSGSPICWSQQDQGGSAGSRFAHSPPNFGEGVVPPCERRHANFQRRVT